MNVLALVGSPRKRGNTDILIDTLLGSAADHGHEAKKVHLLDLEIGPCIDCRGCKKGDQVCVVSDDMQGLYTDLDAADAVVFGSPVYWYGPTASMKLVIDRLRPYYGSGRLRGKKAVIVAPAGDGPDDAKLLVEMLTRVFRSLKMAPAGTVLGTAFDKGDILEDTAAMNEARRVGRFEG